MGPRAHFSLVTIFTVLGGGGLYGCCLKQKNNLSHTTPPHIYSHIFAFASRNIIPNSAALPTINRNVSRLDEN